MWRKLTSLLFEEEEIILEEEEVKVKEIKIKPVEPIKVDKKIEDTFEIDSIQEMVETLEVKEDIEEKRFKMINLEEEVEKPKKKEVKPRPVYEPIIEAKEYKQKEIISPIHGGPKADDEEIEIERTKRRKNVQSRTQVISPMYGKMYKTPETIKEEILELDLESLIEEEELSDEEVQTSLYDFLEGLDNEK